MMKPVSNRLIPKILPALAAICLCSGATAQHYYQGYYYPQPYPQQQYPPQQYPHYYPQQPSPIPQAPPPAQKKKRTVKDTSGDKPPSADVSNIKGPFSTYIWNYKDTLSDLGKASNISSNQLLALNNLSFSQLRDGQALRVPALAITTHTLDIKPAQRDQMTREVWRGIRGSNRVALTYDAGGVKDHLEVLLKNLKEADVTATFFATGQFAEKYEAALHSIHDAGFPIHNHSWDHPDFTTLSDAEIVSQLQRADAAIEKVTGQSTKPYWRPPFGARDSRVLSLAASEGYQSIYWTLDSLDSVGDKKAADFVTDRVLSPTNAAANPNAYLDGAIILMHVGEKGTAEAVPAIVNGLRKRGFSFVTVDEILNH